ncbi:MAG: transcription elongation factor GreA [Myxococcota bacterium]
MEKVPMTPEGFEALKVELAKLKAERPLISKAIGEAMEEGDLKENAEYHAQKDRQGMVEAQIAKIEDAIARAEVIDPSKLSGDKVKFGAKVTLEDVDSGKIVEYRIVGPEESDIDKGTVSVTSPIARALINREVGDEVQVKAPGGLRVYEIQEISWS